MAIIGGPGVLAAVGALLLVTLAKGIYILPFDDQCIVSPWGTIMASGAELTVPGNCIHGQVRWDYPRGILQLIFHQTREFTVCFTPVLGPFLSNISQLIDNRLVTVDSPQEEGKSICLPEPDTTIVAMLEQPPFLTYVTMYNYTVKYQ